jgi:hypothetical protein
MIFLPDKPVIKVMIKHILKKRVKESNTLFLLKFGLIDDPSKYF